MLELVPDPVWKTSSGKSASKSPDMTWVAACSIALACSALITPSSALIRAAAALIAARAWMCRGSRGVPEIGKFSTARWVCARQSASAGTWTSPIESCSMRKSLTTFRLLVRGIQPVVLVAIAEPHREAADLDIAEDPLQRGLELG